MLGFVFRSLEKIERPQLTAFFFKQESQLSSLIFGEESNAEQAVKGCGEKKRKCSDFIKLTYVYGDKLNNIIPKFWDLILDKQQ